MKKAILVGDYDAVYHPLAGVEKELKDIFSGFIEIDTVGDYSSITLKDLKKYDLIIDYIDKWHEKGTDGFAGAMLSYAAQGGAILSIHNGIIKGDNYELCAMHGGAFVMHPPYALLSFKINHEHPIGANLKDMELEIEEEPYGFEMDAFMEAESFLSYKYGEIIKPAGWTRKFAKGRLAYIVPGHNLLTFKNDTYRQLLLQCGKWLCESI